MVVHFNARRFGLASEIIHLVTSFSVRGHVKLLVFKFVGVEPVDSFVTPRATGFDKKADSHRDSIVKPEEAFILPARQGRQRLQLNYGNKYVRLPEREPSSIFQ